MQDNYITQLTGVGIDKINSSLVQLQNEQSIEEQKGLPLNFPYKSKIFKKIFYNLKQENNKIKIGEYDTNSLREGTQYLNRLLNNQIQITYNSDTDLYYNLQDKMGENGNQGFLQELQQKQSNLMDIITSRDTFVENIINIFSNLDNSSINLQVDLSNFTSENQSVNITMENTLSKTSDLKEQMRNFFNNSSIFSSLTNIGDTLLKQSAGTGSEGQQNLLIQEQLIKSLQLEIPSLWETGRVDFLNNRFTFHFRQYSKEIKNLGDEKEQVFQQVLQPVIILQSLQSPVITHQFDNPLSLVKTQPPPIIGVKIGNPINPLLTMKNQIITSFDQNFEEIDNNGLPRHQMVTLSFGNIQKSSLFMNENTTNVTSLYGQTTSGGQQTNNILNSN